MECAFTSSGLLKGKQIYTIWEITDFKETGNIKYLKFEWFSQTEALPSSNETQSYKTFPHWLASSNVGSPGVTSHYDHLARWGSSQHKSALVRHTLVGTGFRDTCRFISPTSLLICICTCLYTYWVDTALAYWILDLRPCVCVSVFLFAIRLWDQRLCYPSSKFPQYYSTPNTIHKRTTR